jgi:hypoxanthine phosphoribosyltransferase
MLEKRYINAQQLLEDAFELGAQIISSEFVPNFIIGVWRGGTPVGIAVQELLDYFDIKTDHIAIRTSYYTGINERAPQVRVHGLNYVVKNLNHDDSLLVVDDVYDSGLSIEAIIAELERSCRRNMPADVRIATAYYKPGNNRTDRAPDYFVHETDKWLVFPHELRGLTLTEIKKNKPGIRSVLAKLETRARESETHP